MAAAAAAAATGSRCWRLRRCGRSGRRAEALQEPTHLRVGVKASPLRVKVARRPPTRSASVYSESRGGRQMAHTSCRAGAGGEGGRHESAAQRGAGGWQPGGCTSAQGPGAQGLGAGRRGVPRSLRLVGSGHPTPLHTTGLCRGSPCLVPQVPDVHCSGASGAGHCQRLAIPFGVLDRARRPFEALSILGRCIKSVQAIRAQLGGTHLYSGCTFFFAAERSGARSAALLCLCAFLHV